MTIAVATTSAMIIGRRGEKIAVRVGEAWDADHPVVQTHPDMFSIDPTDARGKEIPADVVETKKKRRPRAVEGDVTR